MEKKRSVGVTIFGWYYVISSVIGIAIYFIALTPQMFSGVVKDYNITNPIPVKINIIFGIILSIATFIIARKILSLKEIGRKGIVVISVIQIAAFILWTIISFIIYSTRINHVDLFYIIIVPPVTIYFFNRPDIKEQFGMQQINIKETGNK